MAIEVIEWQETNSTEMLHKFEMGGEIKMGAQLVVMENQSAIFFRDGKALDVFGAGRHTLTTANLPLLTKLMAIPFGGKSPFRAEVFFVNRKVFTDLKWGTKEPVAFRDKELKMVRLRAFGKFATRIENPMLFLNTMVGTQSSYDSSQVESYLRDVIVARLNDVLGENLTTIFDLPALYDEISEGLKARVADDFAQYGLLLNDLYLGAITPPEEVQKIMDERAGMEAVGDVNQYMQYKAAQAMGDAAKNEGGAAGMGAGLGMGAGFGMMLPGMINNSMNANQQAQAPSTAPPAPSAAKVTCGKCQHGNQAGAKFCSECGEAMPKGSFCGNCGGKMTPGAKFCSECGTKS